jgi:hypothetical protein
MYFVGRGRNEIGGALKPALSDFAGKQWSVLMNHKCDADVTISHTEFNSYMDREFKETDPDHDETLDVNELGHLHAMLLGK